MDSGVKQASLSGTPLRVFALGVGNAVSTALCEGIARAGGGVSLFAADSSEIIEKCSRLVGAGIDPIITNISVDWGAKLTEDQPAPDEILGVKLKPHPAILQSPPSLTTLYRNHRFVVFAILRTPIVPRAVILRGEVRNGRTEEVEHYVPVVLATRFTSLVYSSAFLHALAARGVIRDLRDRQCILEPSTHCDTRREIIRLGMRYQLASEFTSFVGVEEGETVEALRTAWHNRRAERRRKHRYHPKDLVCGVLVCSWGVVTNVADAISWIFGRNQPLVVAPTRSGSHINMPGRFASPSPSPSRSSRSSRARSDGSDADSEDGYWVDDTVSTVSSLSSHESVRIFRPTRQRWMRRPKPRAPSPDIHIHTTNNPTTPALPHPAPRTEDLALIRLQAWDGSFPATQNLMSFMGRDLATEGDVAAELGVEEDIWATALVIEHLMHNLRDQQELLDGLLVKVLEFAHRRIDRGRFEELRARARARITS